MTANAPEKLPETGYYCSACSRVVIDRPPDGICARCPDEPTFDLSDPDCRRDLAHFLEDQRYEQKGSQTVRAALFSLLGGVVCTVACFWFGLTALGVAIPFAIYLGFRAAIGMRTGELSMGRIGIINVVVIQNENPRLFRAVFYATIGLAVAAVAFGLAREVSW